MSQLHWITFYTKGEPFDSGLNLTESEKIFSEQIKKYVDHYEAYTPEILRNIEGSEIIKKFDDIYQLKHNPGLHTIGMGMFKPFILIYHLNKLKDGDIIIYRDVNCIKYPTYLNGISNIRNTTEYILNEIKADIWMPFEPGGPGLKCNAKKIMLDKYKKTVPRIYDFPLLMANTLIIRKSEQSISILKEWLDIMANNNDWLIPLPEDNNFPEFTHLTPEQAIFSAIVAEKIQMGLLPSNYPVFTINWRILDINQLIKY